MNVISQSERRSRTNFQFTASGKSSLMMDATIGEPFLLSSYSISQRLPKSAASGKARQTPSNVYATHDSGSRSSDGYVTVTAQGDGVHVIDVGIEYRSLYLKVVLTWFPVDHASSYHFAFTGTVY